MSNKAIQPTALQQAKLAFLKANYGLSDSDIARCLFFSEDQEIPFIPAEFKIAIARRTNQFSSIDAEFSSHVPSLNQLVYKGTVIDLDGRSITRTGVATIGEKPNGEEMDPHKLAENRSLSQALDDFGFNPFKTNFVAVMAFTSRIPKDPEMTGADPVGKAPVSRYVSPEAQRRKDDLAIIHQLAEEKGLMIKLNSGGWDTVSYRDWLERKFGVRSAATLDQDTRAQVINKLKLHGTERDDFSYLPPELQQDALIA